MTADEICKKLKEIAPTVAFSVSRRKDPYFLWGGDGPDPEEDGLFACDVTVTAATIIDGMIIEASSYLGGSYFADDQPTGDIGGYLPQMLEEAAADLRKNIPVREAYDHLDLAILFLRQEMRHRYNTQRKEISDKDKTPIV